MPPYPNLVSDSTLVQDTIDLLHDSGGRAAASEIVDAVFKLSHIDNELAGLLVADLIRNDRRFKIIDNDTVELQQDAGTRVCSRIWTLLLLTFKPQAPRHRRIV